MNVPSSIILLQSIGLTQTQIASEIGCSQANISMRKRVSCRPSNKLVAGLQKLLAKYGLDADGGEKK